MHASLSCLLFLSFRFFLCGVQNAKEQVILSSSSIALTFFLCWFLQKAYVEAVVWNADKTRKNKAKRDKKKAKKTRSGATSPTSQGTKSQSSHDSD
jgi:hypothetical protein